MRYHSRVVAMIPHPVLDDPRQPLQCRGLFFIAALVPSGLIDIGAEPVSKPALAYRTGGHANYRRACLQES
jgi:hypothetical protein